MNRQSLMRDFPIVVIATLLTAGVFWFVYLHQMLRARIVGSGGRFPALLFWVMASTLFVGQALWFLVGEGARELYVSGLVLSIVGHLAAIGFFVFAIVRGGLPSITWALPALSGVSTVVVLAGAFEASRSRAAALETWGWVPELVVFFVAWYAMHRDLVRVEFVEPVLSSVTSSPE